MAETCCCGCCTLVSATTTAVVICVLESILGLFWNVQLLMLFYGGPTSIFSNFVNVDHFENYDAVNGLVLASAGTHIFWIIFGIIALRANVNLHRGLMTPWVLFTYLLTGFDIGASVYFLVKFQEYFLATPILYSQGPTHALSYLVLAALFSRGLIMWFVNVFLAHVVDRRGKEIDRNNSLLAFYIMSHLSHPPQSLSQSPQSGMERGATARDPPPAYTPNYLPKYVAGDARCLDTSWTFDNEVAAGFTAFSNPMFARLAQSSVTELGHNSQRIHGHHAMYGTSSMEQSIRTTEGVLP